MTLLAHTRKVLVAVLALFAGTVLAQATWPVQVLIPELITVRAPSDALSFDLLTQNYPPLEFPATFSGGILPVQVHSSSQQSWTLSLEVSDIIDETGVLLVPASQVMYRVNEGGWLRADGFPQVIHAQNGPTLGWMEFSIEFQLELTGTERAGTYQVTASITAQTEAF